MLQMYRGFTVKPSLTPAVCFVLVGGKRCQEHNLTFQVSLRLQWFETNLPGAACNHIHYAQARHNDDLERDYQPDSQRRACGTQCKALSSAPSAARISVPLSSKGEASRGAQAMPSEMWRVQLRHA